MGIGHKCSGGGAAINNSPIVIHIHIHSNHELLIQKALRGIYAAIGKRHIAIENASGISEADISRGVLRVGED